jgi:hypothetical protein
MNKVEILQRQKKKLKRLKKKFLIAELKKRGVKFYEGETRYADSQIIEMAFEVNGRYPADIRTRERILYNIENKEQVDRILSCNNDLVYLFLKDLQKPAKEFFVSEVIQSNESVLQYLVSNYDREFKSLWENFNAIRLLEDKRKVNQMEYEIVDSLEDCLSVKEEAVKGLLEAFVERGVPKSSRGYDSDSISKAMTASRYAYLNNVALSFNKNPESQEVIDFISHLPGNCYFDFNVSLPCDDPEEFRLLKRNYFPGNCYFDFNVFLPCDDPEEFRLLERKYIPEDVEQDVFYDGG